MKDFGNNIRWRFVTWLTIKATDLSDFLLRNRNWPYTLQDYARLPEDTVGYAIYRYMTNNKIPFKGNLSRHDVKHILLGYEMKMPDELKIHSFLFGNRSNNIMGITYLFICSSIVPEIIPQLRKDFRRGKRAAHFKSVDLLQLIEQPLKLIQKQLKL